MTICTHPLWPQLTVCLLRALCSQELGIKARVAAMNARVLKPKSPKKHTARVKKYEMDVPIGEARRSSRLQVRDCCSSRVQGVPRSFLMARSLMAYCMLPTLLLCVVKECDVDQWCLPRQRLPTAHSRA